MKILGTITRVAAGKVGEGKGERSGQPWQQLTVEGVRVFVPLEMQNGWERGQRVRVEVVHQGDKKITDKDGKTLTYEPTFELLNIERVMVAE